MMTSGGGGDSFFERSEREGRAIERSAWASFGDRTLMLSATVLGLSTLFLARDIPLTNTVLLRVSWLLFGTSMMLGLARLLLDWLAARTEPSVFRSSGARRLFIRSGRGTGIFGATTFMAGLGVLIAFAWLNLTSLTGVG